MERFLPEVASHFSSFAPKESLKILLARRQTGGDLNFKMLASSQPGA